jgi:hypothetical protein
VQNAHVNIIHRLLLLIETLVEAANENFYSTPLNGSLFQDHEKLIGDYQLSVFLEKMNDTEITANNKVSKAMASILPYLTYYFSLLFIVLLYYIYNIYTYIILRYNFCCFS